MRALSVACLALGYMALGSIPAVAAEPTQAAAPGAESVTPADQPGECCCKKMMKKAPEHEAVKEGEHQH